MVVKIRISMKVNIYAITIIRRKSLNIVFKLDLERAEEPQVKLPTSVGSLQKQESSRKNIYFCFIGYTEDFDCVDHNKLVYLSFLSPIYTSESSQFTYC